MKLKPLAINSKKPPSELGPPCRHSSMDCALWGQRPTSHVRRGPGNDSASSIPPRHRPRLGKLNSELLLPAGLHRRDVRASGVQRRALGIEKLELEGDGGERAIRQIPDLSAQSGVPPRLAEGSCRARPLPFEQLDYELDQPRLQRAL